MRVLDWLFIVTDEGDQVVLETGADQLDHALVCWEAEWLIPGVGMSCCIAAGSVWVHCVWARAASVIAWVVVNSPSETSLG